MFQQDHRKDFDAVLRARYPFALVRFGDGEQALITGGPHHSADAWRVDGSTWLRAELKETLESDLDGFCLGLPPPCCLLKGLALRAIVRAPMARLTFATLFMHVNLPRALELRDRFPNAVVVSSEYGDIRVPADGVSAPWDIDGLVDELLAVDRPILLAAGPCSNLIAYRYWTRQESHRRQTILDVGSVLDAIQGKISRHYHGKLNDHACGWHEPDRHTKVRVPGRGRPTLGQRVIIGGRREDRPEVQRLGPAKIRIGRR